MTPDDVHDALLEIADAISAEPDTLRRAHLVGEFTQTTTDLRQFLLGETAYEARNARLNHHVIAEAMHCARRTLNIAAYEWARSHGLPLPPTLRNRERIVTDIRVPRRGG